VFTGIVEELGEVVAVTGAAGLAGGDEPSGTDGPAGSGEPSFAQVTVRGPLVTADVAPGDSIAVDGVCLTVVDLAADPGSDAAGDAGGDAAGGSGADTFVADMMAETVTRTTARGWAPGAAVNLERSVSPTTRLGGHLVQGHVDGVGTVAARTRHPGYDDVAIRIPAAFSRYVAPKGAVAVDGVSLTVIDVFDEDHSPVGGGDATTFTVGIIPQTRRATTLGRREVGDTVNI
jgi:riboflavin synthase